MNVRGAFVPRRDDHGGKSEVRGGNGVGIGGHASAAGAHVTHLGAAVFGVVVGLELQGVPVVTAGGKTGDAAVHPLRKSFIGRLHQAFLDIRLGGNACVLQATCVEHGFIGGSLGICTHCKSFQFMTKPPFTGKTCPVTKPLARVSKNSMAAFTSAGTCARWMARPLR